MRLAEAMTYKWAAADLPRGGGKAVLAVSPALGASAREGLLRRYGALLAELSGRFYTGGDVGTSSKDMDVIAETGAPYVFSRTPERGGAGGSGGGPRSASSRRSRPCAAASSATRLRAAAAS